MPSQSHEDPVNWADDSWLEARYEDQEDYLSEELDHEFEMFNDPDYLDEYGDDLYYDYVEEDYLDRVADREAHLDWRSE